MASIFRNTLCLPFLFYEYLQEFSAEGMTEDSIIQAGEAALGVEFHLGMVGPIADRIVSETKDGADPSQNGYRAKKKQLFGTSLSDYLSSLDGERLCIYLADYDPMKARHLYCDVDMHEVMAAAKGKMEYTAEISGVWFEAVLFGMGGNYKGSGPKDEVIDLTADANAGRAKLQKMGLM